MTITRLKNYCAQQERALRIELEALEQQLQQAEARRVVLESEVGAVAHAYVQSAKSGVTAREAVQQHEALDGLARLIQRAKNRAAALRTEWERKQQEVLEAARERRKLEILEERHERQRRRAVEQQEQRLMDEVAGRRRPA
ncbi:MAG: flagellar export protein FliJ [Nitrospirota bacterium]